MKCLICGEELTGYEPNQTCSEVCNAKYSGYYPYSNGDVSFQKLVDNLGVTPTN